MGQPVVQLRTAHQTDIGMVRERNEDAVYCDPEGQFFVVADGMGGHAAGDVASSIAIEVVRARLEAERRHFDDEMGRAQILRAAVIAAHDEIRHRAEENLALHGMGTTIDVALVVGSHATIAHVGDSRVYLVRDGGAIQLTRDHTMAQIAVADGALSPDEARRSPLGWVLSNALGCLPEVTVDIVDQKLCGGDRLVLCTDGLHDGLTPDALASRASACAPDRALAALVGMARIRGGRDNITGVIVEVMPTTPPGWDDEPTIPRVLPPISPPPVAPARSVVPANPLALVPDDALGSVVDQGLGEK